jgi:hypothetical protein
MALTVEGSSSTTRKRAMGMPISNLRSAKDEPKPPRTEERRCKLRTGAQQLRRTRSTDRPPRASAAPLRRILDEQNHPSRRYSDARDGNVK